MNKSRGIEIGKAKKTQKIEKNINIAKNLVNNEGEKDKKSEKLGKMENWK